MNSSSRSGLSDTANHPRVSVCAEEGAAQQEPAVERRRLSERGRQIVDTAYQLLEEEGLEGLTIRAVLKRAGCSRRAFYEHFAGKDDLVLAVFEQTIRLASSHYDRLVGGLSDPLERLKLIVTSLALGQSTPNAEEGPTGNRRDAALSREHLRLGESRPNDLQAALSPLIALIARQLADGMEVGVVRAGDPRRLAMLVYNMVSTTVHSELLSRENEPPDRWQRVRLADDIWEFCRRGVMA